MHDLGVQSTRLPGGTVTGPAQHPANAGEPLVLPVRV